MKIGIISFIAKGSRLCSRLVNGLAGEMLERTGYVPERFRDGECEDTNTQRRERSLDQWTATMFGSHRAMVFVGAAGIAVGAVAPFVRGKIEDSPVIVVDEAGRFVVPILSGYAGGANHLAIWTTRLLGVVLVITTATDVNGLFAVNVFAAESWSMITDREVAKQVSADLLEGTPVDFFSDFDLGTSRVPAGCVQDVCERNIWIAVSDERTWKERYQTSGERQDKSGLLKLVPGTATVGVGCHRGVKVHALEHRVREYLDRHGIDPASVRTLATIDVKQDETTVLALARDRGQELAFYSACELSGMKGELRGSGFIRRTVGTDNVCERACLAKRGDLTFDREAGDGATVAAVVLPVKLNIEKHIQIWYTFSLQVRGWAAGDTIGDSYIYKNQRRLRWGYTTDTYAAAASLAAAVMLLGGRRTEQVVVTTPRRIELGLEVEDTSIGQAFTSCEVGKDAGDDPDMTDGLTVYPRITVCGERGICKGGLYEYKNDQSCLRLMDGVGVGTVTKGGLNCEVGRAAINPVPRQMTFRQAADQCMEYGFRGFLQIEISVLGAVEVTKRAFDSKLGIRGDISILGANGMVEPMNESALLETVRLGLRQKVLAGYERVIIASGNYEEVFLEYSLGIGLDQAVKCSNFIGNTIDMAVREGVKALFLMGHEEKLLKLAAGITNAHSSMAGGCMEILATYGAACGAGCSLVNLILDAITVDEGLRLLETKEGLREQVMERIVERITEHLKQRAADRLGIQALVLTNERGIPGVTPGMSGMLARLKMN